MHYLGSTLGQEDLCTPLDIAYTRVVDSSVAARGYAMVLSFLSSTLHYLGSPSSLYNVPFF